MPEALWALSETLDLRTSLDARERARHHGVMSQPSQRHLRLVASSDSLAAERPARAPRPAVAQAQQLLRSEPSAAWTVSSLARRVAVSRPVLARQFQSEVGTSPMRWLTALRMEQAAERLRQSGEKLAVIAAEVGYQSEFAFNRAFKRHHGLAPGRYRQLTGSSHAFRAAA